MKKLFSTTCIPICAGWKKRPFLSRFAKDEAGNVTIVSIAFIATIGILASISWDLYSHEYHRIKLQQLSDRAVLAAADLDQTLPPEEVVRDYFDKAGYGDVVSTVNLSEGLNFRTVSVGVEGLVKTRFIGSDYYGAAVIGGNVRNDAEREANERLTNGAPADSGKTFDDLYREIVQESTVGDDSTLTQSREIADQTSAARIEARDEALESRRIENEIRAEQGMPPNNEWIPDQDKSNADIFAAEWYQATKHNGPYLRMAAFSEAEERVNNVEIAMVLDISGSMGWNNKMQNLRDAAKTFVDAVINDSTEDLVSVSIVPYAEHVSAGRDILDEFNVDRTHNYSHCMEFEEADFNVTTLGLGSNNMPKQYEQAQHFYWGSTSWNNRTNPVCRYGSADDIEAFSQDDVALKQKIDQLSPNGNTSIFLGMKWAAGLLDPTFQPINASLAGKGHTDPAFVDRPVAYDDVTTLKTVILMTDGQNTSSKRINSQVYANASHWAHWNANSFDWWVNRNVYSSQRQNWSTSKYWPDYGDQLLAHICTAAKDKNIVIWSIGFEVTDYSAGVMQNCASSPSHFFRVEGVQIQEAFSAIARQINQLRLTQ